MINLSVLVAPGLVVMLIVVLQRSSGSASLSRILGRDTSVSWPRRLVPAVRKRLPGGRTRANRRRAQVIEAIGALAAELRAGQPVRTALVRAFQDDQVAPRAVAAARWGGDVATALAEDADDVQQPVLRSLGACWGVAEGSGAGLAAAVERLVVTARASEAVRMQLQAHLAAPRATARMLAGLPLIGVLMGIALGGDPLAWLTSTSIGVVCLTAGIGLTLLGLWWTKRISARVERLL